VNVAAVQGRWKAGQIAGPAVQITIELRNGYCGGSTRKECLSDGLLRNSALTPAPLSGLERNNIRQVWQEKKQRESSFRFAVPTNRRGAQILLNVARKTHPQYYSKVTAPWGHDDDQISALVPARVPQRTAGSARKKFENC